ncbi:DUF1217 domain-containing protein [Limobrevibacterium gyesilva]|uniref:DUF1217 domain-containing protein n=1 Tax=Limobrevibacterium gyesilva TaxID=2991712 RepID=A0AA41YKJ9_9PROT|nr:DUF1217 domain-containing protein [Limobrevibacterium gyesilva]MCW3474071.1 DUF1217 domain-containing protein [Limobrevibacterium gyesilva]
MSGSINFSLLFGAPPAGGSSDLLTALYGGRSGAAAGTSGNPLQALQLAEKTQTRSIATTARQPDVARDIAAFQSAVTAAKDPASLLKNPVVLRVLLTANGLGDQATYPALAQKALLSNAADSNALVNKLTDTRWKSVAQTYDFANKGLSVLQNPQVQSTLANAYAEVTWRKSLDATTPGLSNALSFRQQAGTVTSVDQILGDPMLRDVVTTALNIPQQIAFQPLAAQERAISTRLDLGKLKNAHFVDTLTQQYLLNKASAAASTNAMPSLDDLISQARGLVV